MKAILLLLVATVTLNANAAGKKTDQELFQECFSKTSEVHSIFTSQLNLYQIEEFSSKGNELFNAGTNLCWSYIKALKEIKTPDNVVID